MQPEIQRLINFIDQSPSPWHSVKSAEKRLIESGYRKLEETAPSWNIKAGDKVYVIRKGASLIALNLPNVKTKNSRILGVGSHTDSPCFRLKANAVHSGNNPSFFNLEVYGGPLIASWMDRDLKFAGRVVGLDSSGVLKEVLIETPTWLRVPQLAIHLNRGVNDKGLLINAQSQLLGFCADELTNQEFIDELLKLTSLSKIYSWDLCTADTQPSNVGGMKKDFLLAPRLDNLAMLESSLEALLSSKSDENLNFIASFHHEEIGSSSAEGAESNFLPSILKRIFSEYPELGFLSQQLPDSLFLSADMAHAFHPGYTEKFDLQNHPLLNKGPVLKYNANGRYATDAVSSARIQKLAEENKISLQVFHNRNDMGCGSTIGPANATNLGIPVVDLGNPMHSMNSCREMSGTQDHKEIIKLFTTFFESVAI